MCAGEVLCYVCTLGIEREREREREKEKHVQKREIESVCVHRGIHNLYLGNGRRCVPIARLITCLHIENRYQASGSEPCRLWGIGKAVLALGKQRKADRPLIGGGCMLALSSRPPPLPPKSETLLRVIWVLDRTYEVIIVGFF